MIHDKGHKGVSKVTFWVQKKTATAAATTTTLLEQRLLPPLLSTATKTTDDVLFLASLLRCHNRIPLSFEQLEHDYLGGTKRNFTSKTRTTHLWHLFCAYMTFELQFRWWIDDILYFGHFFRFPPNFTWWKITSFLMNFSWKGVDFFYFFN